MHHPDAVFIDEISPRAIKSLLHEIAKLEFHAGILFSPDLDKLKKMFFKQFQFFNFVRFCVQIRVCRNFHKINFILMKKNISPKLFTKPDTDADCGFK